MTSSAERAITTDRPAWILCEPEITNVQGANLFGFPTLKAYAYAAYTPDKVPHIIPAMTSEDGGSTYIFLQRRQKHPLTPLPFHPHNLPPNLAIHYYSPNGVGPALNSFDNVAGFFELHLTQAQIGGIPHTESAALITDIDWPQTGPILDFKGFTPNPTLTHYEKLQMLRDLLGAAFDYALQIGAEDRMFVIMASHIRTFVASAGIDFDIIGGRKTDDQTINSEVFARFPGYWDNDPLLCRFIHPQS